VRGKVAEFRDVCDVETTSEGSTGDVNCGATAFGDADFAELPAVLQSPRDYKPMLGKGNCTSANGSGHAGLQQHRVVDNCLCDTIARTSRPPLELLPVLRCTLLFLQLAFWVVMTVVVSIAGDELSCDGGLPVIVHIIFGGFCLTISLTELLLSGVSKSGRKLLNKWGKTVLLVCLGVLCRLDFYTDIALVFVARKCESEVWKVILGIFSVGTIITQMTPGLYYMIRFVVYQECPLEALMTTDFHLLVETVDPTDIAIEVPLQPSSSRLYSARRWARQAAAARGMCGAAPLPAAGEYAVLEALPGPEHDQDEHERDLWDKLQKSLAQSELELTLASASRDPDSLIAAVKLARVCSYEGKPLREVRSQLGVEAKLHHLIASQRRLFGTVRLLVADLGQAGAQSFFLYTAWDHLSAANLGLTFASIAIAALVSLCNSLCAWVSECTAQRCLQAKVISELQAAVDAGSIRDIRSCCRGLARMVPDGSSLQQRMHLALLELPTLGTDPDRLKTADVISRFCSVLQGEGRALQLAALRQKWAKAQGIYHVLDAYPAGLLCLIRLEGDVVKGEVVIHGGPAHTCERVQFLSVKLLGPDADGSDAREVFECVGLQVERVSVTSCEHPPDVCIELPEGRELFEEVHILDGLLEPSRYLQFLTIKLGLDSKSYDTKSIWDISNQAGARGGLTRAAVPETLRALVSSIEDRSLTLGMLRAPAPVRLHDPSAVYIKPGLYVGDFGEADYGRFCHEVCLVEYSRFDLRGKLQSEDRVRFSRLFGKATPYPFDSLPYHCIESGSITVASGTKVTGDVHVPMGQVAWVALIEPSHQSLNISDLPELPTGLHDKEGNRVNVIRGWPGAGTLAGIGFKDARWDFGWLLLLTEGRNTRFAFAWLGDLDVIVLSWVQVQDSSSYLHIQKEALCSFF